MKIWQQGMIYLARNETVTQFMQNRARMSELARRFIGGESISEVVETSQNLAQQGSKPSLYYLGEYVEDLDIVDQTVAALKTIAHELAAANLDIFICVDPTQIGSLIDWDVCHRHAVDIAQEIQRLSERTTPSKAHLLMLDMEDASVTEATIQLYEALCAASLPAGLTLQAYLYRTEDVLRKIVNNGGSVRLVKGAFAEGKEIAYNGRSAINTNYLKCAYLMLSPEAKQSSFYPIFATHDDQLIAQIIEFAEQAGWAKDAYEFEMLYGVREGLQQSLIQQGEPLRLYLPCGVDWWPYAVRRVGENPKNASFLVRALVGS